MYNLKAMVESREETKKYSQMGIRSSRGMRRERSEARTSTFQAPDDSKGYPGLPEAFLEPLNVIILIAIKLHFGTPTRPGGSMNAGFLWAWCGEWNETSIDESAGRHQSYIEDCQVGGKPNLVLVFYDPETEAFVVTAELESVADVALIQRPTEWERVPPRYIGRVLFHTKARGFQRGEETR